MPPQALAGERVPVLYYLAGLTCSEETFVIKAGAQRFGLDRRPHGTSVQPGQICVRVTEYVFEHRRPVS